jgi:prophage regulatory protein
MSKRNHSQEYLRVCEVAARYGVSVATVWRWAAEGRIPAPTKLSPGSTRWKLSALIDQEATQ